MALLHAGVDTTVIALWLGHEQTDTTMIYLHADLTLKEKALDRHPGPAASAGRYRPPDACWPSSTTSDPPTTDRIMPRAQPRSARIPAAGTPRGITRGSA